MGTVDGILRWSTALALSTTSAAYAQSTPAQGGEIEEVVVVGLRASLEAAAEIKQNSDLVMDSIVADDIGKFPDNTTAAALQRVPGVQVTVNDNNEIANPIIRGIPDILTTLDGREIFTGVGRAFAFQDLPAEALAGADVFKSSNASLIEGGVAGVINLRLHKPFDFEQGWSGAVNTRGIYGDNVDKVSGTIGGLVSNRWAVGDGEMGALLNVSYSDIDFDRPISFNCDPRSGSNGPAGGAGAILPTCVGGLNQYGDYQRPQVNAAFQWQPSDELEIYADGIYTEYESRWETDFIFSDIFAAQNITNLTPTGRCDSYRVNDAGFQGTEGDPQADPPVPPDPLQSLCVGQSARFNNVPGLTSTQARDSGTDQYVIATGVRWNAGSWHFDGDVSYERSHTENRIIIVDIGKQVPTVDVTVDDDKHGTTDMAGNPLGVADDFRFANSLFQDLNDAVGKQFAVAANGAYDLDGWLGQIQFGLRYADRDSTFRAFSGGPEAPGGNRTTLVSSVDLPGNFLVRSPSSISYINGGQHWLTPNRNFLLDQTDTLRALYGAPAGDPDWNPTRNYDANEQAYAGYLQGKYQFEFGNGWQLDGLLGGRMVRTDREITGTGTVTPAPTAEDPAPAAVLTPVTTDTSDDDFLPSFSARLRLSPDLQFRFSAARTMARPAFEDLNPGLTYEVPINANIRPNGFGGNPNLKSQMSDAYDLTVEYYFARSNYVSAALYYRDIKDRIVDAINPETIDGVTYNITRPRNVGSAELQGIELAGQMFFDFLPGFWSGFGAMANFTLADSEITTRDDVLEGEELLGVSKYSYNLGLLYEQSGVTGRLIYTHRSDYTETLLGGLLAPVGAGAQFNGVRDNGRLDFSLGYDFTDYLTVSIDGTNLTQARYYSYFGNESFPHDVRDDERTFGVSLRARF
ncbi:TonB-dependent receptor [Peristeroidobacter agariperforans]|uniref:TonB-dependent receptor n=1 Tax=Peristeroidobacter agariperforans TaxID=268404 RepID=UPI00101D2578|nr:TonB-dependent receptor [Peristeroidobacter agariperforans]